MVDACDLVDFLSEVNDVLEEEFDHLDSKKHKKTNEIIRSRIKRYINELEDEEII